MHYDATASYFVSIVQSEVFAHFHSLTVMCVIDCLACQDEFFVNNPLDVTGNDNHFHYFILRPSHPFQSE
jgi:hypothetical protein